MIKAIIYDMDDLMVDSDPLHNLAWEKLLSGFNHKFSELPEELRAKFIGLRVIDTTKEIVKALKLDTDPERLYEKRTEIFLDLARDKLKALPGLNKTLRLFTQNGLMIALASSGNKPYIQLVLDKFKIKDFFDIVVSGDDVRFGKPNPEIYLVACKKLGFRPEECVVLEDAKNGIESAKAAGCKCIAIINLHTPAQDHSKADLILNSLEELSLETINSLN
jgi:beta-phosphoglucomutase